MKNIVKSLAFLILIMSENGCGPKVNEHKEKVESKESLSDAFKDDFFIGAAINDGHINGTDTSGIRLIKKQFNTITPENIMKWMYIHPEKNRYDFENSDKYVALGIENKMHVVGHALVWHSQIADWMNQVTDSLEMANILKDHIAKIVGRYKGKIDAWDVVNEALNEDGSFRESLLYNVMGDSFLELSFIEAKKADPNAQLIYNDYNLWKPEKRDGVIRFVKNLQTKGIKIDGIGMQGHYSSLGPPIEEIENSIIAFSELGVKVMFTELDVTALPNPWDLNGAAVELSYDQFEGDPIMNPFPTGMPDSMEIKMIERYEDLFRLFIKHDDKLSRITFWGVNDGQSWLNNWPINGRTNYPLLFDRQFKPKKAYAAIINLKDKQ